MPKRPATGKRLKTVPVNPLEALDKQYLWHPFTQMQDWQKEHQLIIERGKGSWLVDTSGKKYLDGVSSLWVTVHGHRKKEIDRAVAKQLGKIAHSTLLGLSNVPAVQLAEKLIAVAPKGLSRVFYSDSGSSAVEVALKMAFQYWQLKGPRFQNKTGFISLTEAYHGDTIGSVSVGGIDAFHRTFRPLLFKSYRIEAPYCYRCKYALNYPDCQVTCLRHAETTIQKYASVTAALIIEPLVQGAAGMLLQPPGFLKRIREICTQNNILLIADEVATGFGRTGTLFACEQEKVAPDLMAVAKGITGGYLPLAATLTTEELYSAFLGEHRELKTFFHGHTYTGNPLACAAAIANIDLFRTEKTLQRLQPKIKLLTKELQRFRKLEHVGEVRQKGFMVGIELVRNRGTREAYVVAEKIGARVTLEARKRGLIIRPLGNVIVLMPPLSITQQELKRLLDITFESIRTVTTLDTPVATPLPSR
jgi:adenosylmethionine-8-amino-7-oxononanoate aminotransferase